MENKKRKVVPTKRNVIVSKAGVVSGAIYHSQTGKYVIRCPYYPKKGQTAIRKQSFGYLTASAAEAERDLFLKAIEYDGAKNWQQPADRIEIREGHQRYLNLFNFNNAMSPIAKRSRGDFVLNCSEKTVSIE